MSPRRRSIVLWSLTVPAIVLAVAVPFLSALTARPTKDPSDVGVVITFTIFILAFAVVGRLVASRHPQNPIGWLMVGSALGYTLAGAALFYATYSVRESSLPAVGYVASLGTTGWAFGAAFSIFILLLFPDGHYLSRRWKVVGKVFAIGLGCAALGWVLQNEPLDVDRGVIIANPLGVGGPIPGVLRGIGFAAYPLTILIGAVGAIFRFRRTRGEARQQMKWLTFGGFVLIASVLGSTVAESQSSTETASNIANILETASLAFLPIAIGIAILKYRLYDIDVVINKTIVFGGLAAFITGIYVAIVVGIGTALGSSGKPNLALSIAATAVVAIAFTPVKERVQRFANRLVYGTRQSPYEVLADVAHAVASTTEPDEALEAIARGAVLGTGASSARVSLSHEGAHIAERTWPRDLEKQPDSIVMPVTHRDEVVGELALSKQRGEAITAADRKLVEDLASNAGLALYNARLNLELTRRLEDIKRQTEDLRLSRERIVSARDDSRRRLERDISLGPSRRLVDTLSRLHEARAALERDPLEGAEVLEGINREATATLEELRELARGLYPPLLVDKGLVPALEAHFRKKDIPATVDPDGIGDERFEESIEACIYFFAVEVLSDVQTDSRLSLELIGDSLRFKVEPFSGSEGLRALQDRVEALGGSVTLTARDLVGTVPARVRAGIA